jgi:hypothetical protein
VAEPPLDFTMPVKVMSVAPFESPELSLEKDVESFIEEKDYSSETIELPKEEALTRPLVELKETLVIISDKLSEQETTKLLFDLEKHRPVFGYSLVDLKGISPTLCIHHIPIDPDSTPSREPQRRLNNAMREVMKKEVLKLLHAGIIYLVPHSD